MSIKSKINHNRQSSALRIFFIILLAIVIDQAMESVLLESVAPIDPTGLISNIFLASSIPFAIFLASLSDYHCRRKMMIFTTISMLLSGIAILFFNKINIDSIAYIALALKGIGGNVTPVALASLATIVSPKQFTMALAAAIWAYSIGSWGSIYTRSFEYLPLLVVVLSLCCSVIIVRWFKETEFDHFSLTNNTFNFNHFAKFAIEDWKLIGLFCILPPVVLAFSGYIFSEISFYQILLRGEVLITDIFYSKLSFTLGIGYFIGTIILCILQIKNFSDKYCIKLGVLIAFLSIFLSFLLNYSNTRIEFLDNLFMFIFSFGFSLFIPAMFSILSKIKKQNEQGKIYGLVDSTDTLSTIIATKYIKSSKSVPYTHVLWLSSTLMFLGGMLILSFIHYVKKMRRANEHQSKERKNSRKRE